MNPAAYLTAHDAVNPQEGYAAHFVFRYRPLGMFQCLHRGFSLRTQLPMVELLQAQDIAPRIRNTSDDSNPSSQPKNHALKRSNSDADKYSPDKRPRNATSLDTDVIELSDDDDDDFKTLQV